MELRTPYVYLIHRSEDKPAAKELAESLLARGIDVWFDEWEIVAGDLVVRKMEEGLTACDGALVFVSDHGVGERWAGEEYEAVLAMRHADSPDRAAPFIIPVLHGHAPKLTPFLMSRQQRQSSDIAGIADSIFKHLGFSTSDKPALGKLRGPEGPLEILIELDRDGDQIIARWGEHEGRAHLPEPEAERLREELRAAGVTRDRESRASFDRGHLEALGQRLGAVFSGALKSALAEAVVEASAERRLLIRLRATDRGAALLSLPWEAATLPGQLTPLGIAPRTALVREVAPERPTLLRAIDGPLRVLVAVAAPDDNLDTAAELGMFLDGLERAHVGRTRLAFIDAAAATLDGIREALDREPFHVLHISAHGGPDSLLFESESGSAQPIPAKVLAEVLVGVEHPPQLVVLSACSTGAPASGIDRLHVAEVLLGHGIPQVIAMQGPVGDGYATELARHFYEALALASAPSPAQALGRARARVEQERLSAARNGNRDYRAPAPEFATPAFYAASTVGEATFFDATRPWEPVEPPPRLGLIDGFAARSAETLVGRRQLQRDLQRALIQGGGALLWGMGGAGKSSLAASVAERLLRRGWGVAVVVGVHSVADLAHAIVEQVGERAGLEASGQASGRESGTIGGAQLDLSTHGLARLRALAAPDQEEKALLGQLCELLLHERLLLVLDNFEDNLSQLAGGVPETLAASASRSARLPSGQQKILSALLDSAQRGAVLITCRYPLEELKDDLATLSVGPLGEPAIRQLVWRLEGLRGLPQDELRPALRTLGGHPRILEFADALIEVERRDDALIDTHGHKRRFREVRRQIARLAEEKEIELRDELDAALTPAEVVEQARQLAAADILLGALLGTLDPPTKRFLGAVAVYRRPVPLDALDAVADTVEPTRDERQRREAIRLLHGRALLSGPLGGPWMVHRWTAAELSKELGSPALAHLAAATWWLNVARSGNPWEAIEAGEHRLLAEDIEAASKLAHELVVFAQKSGASLATEALIERMLEAVAPDSRLRWDWLDESAGLYIILGDTARAHSLASEALLLAEGLAKADPHNALAQRDLSNSLDRLGDLEVATGNIQVARLLFGRYLEIAERLAKADPHNAPAQRILSVALGKLGNVEVDLQAARFLFARSLEVAEALAKADPHSAQAQRDLSVSLVRLGNLEMGAGKVQTAHLLLARYLEIAEGLANADPHSALAQRDLSLSLNNLGGLEVATGNLQAARLLFARSLEVAEGLANADPHNALARHDLFVSLNNLGEVEVAAGNLQTARLLFARWLEVAERLAKADPHSTRAQRDLSISLNKLGDVEVAAGNLQEARLLFARCSDILKGLAKADGHSAQAQRDLAVSYERMAQVEGDRAAESLGRSVAIRRVCFESDPTNAIVARDLAFALFQLGCAQLQDNQEAEAIPNLAQAQQLLQRLREQGALEARFVDLADMLAQAFG